MGWGNGSSPEARQRRRFTIAATAFAGLFATAFGATGVRSLAETFALVEEAPVERLPALAATDDSASAVAVAATAAPQPTSPVTPTVARPLAIVPVGTAAGVAPTARPVRLAAGRSARLAVTQAESPAVVAKPASAALALPPVRSTPSISDSWFGGDDASSNNSARPLADRGGRAIAVADATPTLDLDSLVDLEPTVIPTPRKPVAGPLTGVPAPRLPAVLPPLDQVLDGAATGIDSDTGLSANDPTYGVARPRLGGSVVPPPLDRIVDNGGMGVDTDPLLESELIPPVQPSVGLPWEQLVNSGVLDLPRGAMDPNWTPGNGEFQDVIVMPDGSILVVPEPTTLAAVAATGVALLGRRRRRA